MINEPPYLQKNDPASRLAMAKSRLIVVGMTFCLAYCLVGIRLTDLMLLREKHEPSVSTALHKDNFRPGRGNIYDRNGMLLATSLPTFSLYADPLHIHNPRESAEALIKVLPEYTVEGLVEKFTKKGRFVWLKRNLTPEQHYSINKLGITGLCFQSEEKRVYPHGETAAHTLGMMDIDGHGVMGAERAFNQELAEGKPIKLALDMRVCHILRKQLKDTITEFRAAGASAVVMDIHKGEIIGAISLPDFDPNLPPKNLSDNYINKSTQSVFEMGSMFKLITVASALDSGVVDMNSRYDATRPIHFARHTIHDYKAKNIWMSIPEIIKYSSNIGAAKVAMDMGKDLQQEYLKRLRLFNPPEVEFVEKGSPLYPKQWRDINTMTISFGHGIAVTPIHMANAIGSLINGGKYYKPSFLLHDTPPEGEEIFVPETTKKMCDLMRLVVTEGSGRKADVENYDVGGKTGSAEMVQGGRYAKNEIIASFVAAFPMKSPKYVVLVSVEKPVGNARTFGYRTGGWVAAPAAKEIICQIGPLLGVKPTLTKTEPDANAVSTQCITE